MSEIYRSYFDIDPEYFPQVTDKEIEKYPDLWKKFYPHETFVKLLKDMISVLSRRQKLSIWVEGAYGTGKSHAALTLKKLLDASPADTKAYFDRFPHELSDELYQRFQQQKESGKILTVHRYTSSDILNDADLAFALQESIVRALHEAGLSESGIGSLREAAIDWLSGPNEKRYFDGLIHSDYAYLFSGDSADDVIEKLRTYEGKPLETLMGQIMKVGKERNFLALSLNAEKVSTWIRQVIHANGLKAIVFVWDEFTDYFRNNMKSLTGFQQIAEISATDPFYLVIVTHKSEGLFGGEDKNGKRILDRFVRPPCNISLPENMAFRLMGAAMKVKEDLKDEWEEITDDLYDRTTDSRVLVQKKANITKEELERILPIHPYAALLLKHISAAFQSNQRSMFDFIKNDRGEEAKGFQWFIDHCGPLDDNPLLTVDMLWDFFYETGRSSLAADIRTILDCYARAETKSLRGDEKRVLKTVLMLQAISQSLGGAVELFIPNEKNVQNAFEGSELGSGQARQIAEKLCKDQVLYKKPLGGGKEQYSAMSSGGDLVEIEQLKQGILQQKTTKALIDEAEMAAVVAPSEALGLRYVVQYTSAADLKRTAGEIRGQAAKYEGKIPALVVVAKNDQESAAAASRIQECMEDPSYHIVFIDATATTLGERRMDLYAEAMANAAYQQRKDNKLAAQYSKNAKEVLTEWRNLVSDGRFDVFYRRTDGSVAHVHTQEVEPLYDVMKEIDREYFPCSLEKGSGVTSTMWQATSRAMGAEAGASEELKGAFRSQNESTKLENYIGRDAWKQPAGSQPYWEAKPHLLISKIKLAAEAVIADAFASSGRVSIREIYEALRQAPFGFLPCNLTAFVLGFILKEYVDGTYSWSDGTTSDKLTMKKFKEMVDELLKQYMTPSMKYRDQYIVKLTEEEKAFNETSASAFGIPLNQCTNVEQTRDRIRNEMKKYAFPLWCAKYALAEAVAAGREAAVSALIDLYMELANGENDQDTANRIGKLCLATPALAEDLKKVCNSEMCTKGMTAYLSTFDGGILPELAKNVGDQGQYVTVLRKKFNADAANWVWKKETADAKIGEVILEYRIIAKTNALLATQVSSFTTAISEWQTKCRFFRLSYAYIKSRLSIELGGLMDLLAVILQAGSLSEMQKKDFFSLLESQGSAFRALYDGQKEMFLTSCEFYLRKYDFTAEEIDEIYHKLPTSVFLLEGKAYIAKIEELLADYNAGRSSAKLKAFWKEKTETDSPLAWSRKYKMPLLCMVGEADADAARVAFTAVNQKKVDAATAEAALDILSHADIFGAMKDDDARDEAFRRLVIGDYAVILTDITEVKAYLESALSGEPYNWLENPYLKKRLEELANDKYMRGGADPVLDKIEKMDAAEAKRYLKQLVKENLKVGMEIIRHR